jgi:hypothetical protein
MNMGQGRWLVNLSATSYTTGTITSVGQSLATGSGTTWTNGMVGGDVTLPGCIAFTADDMTFSPFNGGNGPLKLWMGIQSVASTTTLVPGPYGGYTGLANTQFGPGPGAGAYTVRPCARVLEIIGNQVVLERNVFTWTVNDNVENALSSDGAVDYTNRFIWYSPGAALNNGYRVTNAGARTFQNGIAIDDAMIVGGGADTVPYREAIHVQRANIGLRVNESLSGTGVLLQATTTTALTRQPGYGLTGGNLNFGGTSGLYGDYTTGDVFLNRGTENDGVTVISGRLTPSNFVLSAPIGLQLTGGTQPTCNAAERGAFWYVPGAGGVKDSVAVCAKDAADAYAWRTIY